MDPNSSTPIVVLKGADSDAILPIWVGAFEANAIALEIEKVVPQRPMTHDLLRNLITQAGFTVERITVNDLIDNTFYAVIEMLDEQGQPVTLDARPSDAIALALRADCPIFVAQRVLDISSSGAKKQDDFASDEPAQTSDEWPDVVGDVN